MGGYDPFLRSSKAIYSGKTLPWTLGYVTEFWDGLTGITVTGQGVSTWVPVKGTHNFTQGTDGARPTYSNGVLTFNGSDEFLATGAFTLNQPCTFFMVVNQITWTGNDSFCDGAANTTGWIYQVTSTPQIGLFAGGAAAPNGNLAVGVYGAVIGVFNGASSILRVNNTTETTGNAGANNPGGLTLGAGATPTAWSNIAVKAFGYAAAALDASQRAQLARSLMQRYGVA